MENVRLITWPVCYPTAIWILQNIVSHWGDVKKHQKDAYLSRKYESYELVRVDPSGLSQNGEGREYPETIAHL